MPDYEALAKQAGAVSSEPAAVDYDAIAKQAGAVSSEPSRQTAFGSVGDQVVEGVSHLVSGLNPINLIKGAKEFSYNAMVHPIDTARALGDSSAVQAKIVDAYKRGNYAEALRHIPGLLPFVGNEIDRMGDEAEKGNVGAALGDAAAFGVTNFLPGSPAGAKIAAKVTQGVKVSPKLLRNPNAAEAEAVAFGQKNNIPVSAGTASGNKFVAGAQAVVDHSPLGSIVAQGAKADEAAAFTRVGRELADQVHPTAVAPTQAGAGVTQKLEGEVARHHGDADSSYGNLRELAADPANLETKQIGTKQVPSGVMDDAGNPVMRTVPVTEDIPMPVNVAAAAKQLKPIYASLTRNMAISKQRMSDGLQAIKNIIDSPPWVSAEILDRDLSVIKAAARGADLPELKSLSQGLASLAVKALDDEIRKAVANAKRSAPAAGAVEAVSAPVAAEAAAAPVAAAAPEAAAARVLPAQAAGSIDTKVTVPGSPRAYKAKYEVRERADVQASHNAQTFQPNTKFPLKNERNYNDPVNQGKIIDWSSESNFDGGYHITDNPDAVNGPLVITTDGAVLGGNGRKMILDRVYAAGKGAAARYRALLESKAAQFGIDPELVRGMREPVLVRVVDDAEFKSPGSKADAIADFNKKGTAELTPAERAIADSRRVSQGTLDHVAAAIESQGHEGTLGVALNGNGGVEVLNKLIDDGVISPQERAAFANEAGLTAAGKDRISQLMLGRFFRDPAQLDRIPAAIRNRLERVAGPLARTESAGEWNLTPHVQSALDLLEESRAHGGTIDDFLNTGGLFVQQNYSPQAIALAKHLKSTPSKQLTDAVRGYASDAQFAAGGASMFGDNPTPASSFETSFGATVPTNEIAAAAEAGPGAKAARPSVPAGDEALGYLEAGRKSTVAKYNAADVLKQLRDEPRQVFDQAVWSKDAGIEKLKEIAKLAPGEMRKIGRAYLDELLESATAEGGFDKTRTLWAKWQNLGPETKQILFGNPMLVKDLDNFFLLAKKAAESPNPSGSALVGSLTAGVGYTLLHPVTGVPMLIAGGALSKLLHSPAGVAALSKGFTVRVGGAQGAIAAARILKLAGDAARPVPPELRKIAAGQSQTEQPFEIAAR